MSTSSYLSSKCPTIKNNLSAEKGYGGMSLQPLMRQWQKGLFLKYRLAEKPLLIMN
jgi:hypothetical protein